MEIIGFFDIVSRFELQIQESFQIELLELHYIPYSFGFGFVVYKRENYKYCLRWERLSN